MKKPSTQRSTRNLERILKWVLGTIILINLLLFLPRQIPYIRLDLIHPSLPVISLDALRIDNLPFMRDFVQGVESHTSANAIKQNPIALNPSITSTSTPSPPQPNSTSMNSTTDILTTRPTSTNTANPTSTSPYAPTNTPTSAPPSPTLTAASIKMYYVAPNGDDSNPGTIDQPWRTLAPVHARDFLPGDVIHFKRGGSWSGGIVIDDSGVQGNPITFTAYGTGNRPIFTNPGGAGSYTKAVEVRADWVVVDGFLAQDAHEAGVYISNGSDHNIVRDVEATNVGIGIAIRGQYNLATRNYVHDLHMVVNTPGGDDDFGAVGIWFFNSNNEASYNRIENCKAPSYDYGYDGGVFEFFGYADNNLIHHNWGETSDLAFEAGGGSAKNNTVAYNVFINNIGLGGFHLQGKFASEVENFRFENNVIVDIAHDYMEFVMIWWNGDPSESTFIMRNNIFYLGNFQFLTSRSGFTHNHNVYYLINDITQMSKDGNYSLDVGELIDDPLFVDISNNDFHLQINSPAIDAGVDLGYSLDFDGNLVPRGARSDIGAYEY